MRIHEYMRTLRPRRARLRSGAPLDLIRANYIADKSVSPVERLLLSIILALIGLCIGLVAWLTSDLALEQRVSTTGSLTTDSLKIPTLTTAQR